VKAAEFVVQVRCLHCRHKRVLSNEELGSFGIKAGAPIASFVKRLRCSNCGKGSVMANRIGKEERITRRLRA
jgi:ribosomal protein S27AE